MASFPLAFERLLRVAPGPVFPRARQLYLRKYCLEGPTADGAFRTFLLEEDIQEGPEGVVRVRALSFALVHWQAPQTTPEAYAAYLCSQWELEPAELQLADEQWFRQGGAYACFRQPLVFERGSSGELLLADGGDPLSR
ncbi:MAG: hypothetical protein ACOVNL_08370 [Prochlorococcaceae cyanobacterium]|jgi:hypothetical protein